MADEAERAYDELVGHLRALLRLPTVNPPGDEILAARYLAHVLSAAGLQPRLLEPFPGRGDVVVRLRGDGSGGGPLLLLSHLDVVPVDRGRWTQDPFGGGVMDGRIYGRGALDMKGTVAMQLQVVLELAREARAAGSDPARDPIPGLGRDVIFAGTADEEAGGVLGIGWIVEHEPELLQADVCLTEAGGVSVELLGRRFYPIQVAEKGLQWYRIVVRGTAGHASMPRDDNAAVLASEVVRRLAEPGPPRLTSVMRTALESVALALPSRAAAGVRRLLDPDPVVTHVALETVCEEPYRRALRALLRDTFSPNVIQAGSKPNVIPGSAEVYVDCRLLPGTTAEQMTAELRARLGEELLRRCEVTPLHHGAAVEQPLDGPLYGLLADALRAHDPEAVVVPIMAPFSTDAKHTARLGIPTYGFSPLRLGRGERFLELFHGDDEHVSLSALRWGLPVFLEVVRRYCRAIG